MALAFGVALARIVPPMKLAANEAARDRATERAGDWTRLRDEVGRLAERLKNVEAENVDCHKNLADAVRRIAELEGYNVGRGTANQEVQMIVSHERQIDAAEAKAKARKPGLRRDKP